MKLQIILLCAGNSKRFGSDNKLLYKINGKRMFEYSVDLVEKLREDFNNEIENIVIVSKYEEIKNYIKNKKMIYIENPKSEEGISSSLILGLKEWKKNKSDYIMFMVCDQPYMKFLTLKNFLEEFFNQSKGIGVLSFEKRLGNPCVFSSKYVKELEKLSGDVGGKKIIKRNLDDTYYFEISDEKELEDIDFLNKILDNNKKI